MSQFHRTRYSRFDCGRMFEPEVNEVLVNNYYTNNYVVDDGCPGDIVCYEPPVCVIDDREKWMVTFGEQRRRIIRLEKDNVHLSNELEHYKRKFDESEVNNKRLSTELNTAREKIKKIERENVDLANSLEEHKRNCKAKLDQLQAQLNTSLNNENQLKLELRQSQDENNRLRNDLNDANRDKLTLTQQVNELKHRIDQLNQDLGRRNREFADQQQRLNGLTTEIQSLRNQLNDSGRETNEAKLGKNRAEGEIKLRDSEIERLNLETRNQADQIAKLKRDVESAEMKKHEWYEERRYLTSFIYDLITRLRAFDGGYFFARHRAYFNQFCNGYFRNFYRGPNCAPCGPMACVPYGYFDCPDPCFYSGPRYSYFNRYPYFSRYSSYPCPITYPGYPVRYCPPYFDDIYCDRGFPRWFNLQHPQRANDHTFICVSFRNLVDYFLKQKTAKGEAFRFFTTLDNLVSRFLRLLYQKNPRGDEEIATRRLLDEFIQVTRIREEELEEIMEIYQSRNLDELNALTFIDDFNGFMIGFNRRYNDLVFYRSEADILKRSYENIRNF